ncbi:unnamed protein product [Adineta steineri]|uniref:Iodothyronine deiodinase n=2 Tax=Adineta steineri TaxID=433720 RepID=A0A819AMX1_9BILA|nr:unnamed protein product [Adineta steineri]CAF3787833.1 unnamed protein product [Adineta steineri]
MLVSILLLATLRSLWIVITFQEKQYIEKAKKAAEQDRKNSDHQMPNEFIQGAALNVETTPPSVLVRSALRPQFWISYWKILHFRCKLDQILPSTITEPGKPIPESAEIIPVFTQDFNRLDNDDLNIETINLRSLMKQGRYLVLNFEAHASDGFKFSGPQYSFIANHRNIKDRLDAVKIMIEMAKIDKDSAISVYCDTMNNRTNQLFRGSPERLYVLHDQKVLYQGGKGPNGYSIPSLEYILKKNLEI